MSDRPERAPAVPTTEETDVPSQLVLKRRPFWPILAVFGAIVFGIGGFIYWRMSRPDPLKVLIAIDMQGTWWEGSRPAAVLSDEIAEGLSKIGFEPVKGGDPKVDKILSKAKSPEEAARALGAGFVITGRIDPEIIEHPIEGGYFEVRTVGKVQVRNVSDPEGKFEEGSVASWSGGKTKEQALHLLAQNVAIAVFDAAVPKIADHPAVSSQFDGGDIDKIVRLQDAKKYVDARASRLDRVRRAYERVDQDHAESPKSPLPVEYHGKFAAQDALCGAGAEGVLLHSSSVTPFIVPKTLDLGWKTELETLAWRGPDGKDRVLWSGYHLYSYPSVAPDGKTAVFVEDLFGWAKTLTVVDPDGKARRLRVDASSRFIDPKIAPGGSAAALYVRPCRTCATSFLVLSLKDGASLYDRAATTEVSGDDQDENYGGYAWLDDKRVAFIVKPKAEPLVVPATGVEGSFDPKTLDIEIGDPGVAAQEVVALPRLQELRSVDISASPPKEEKVGELAEGERCDDLASSPDGKTVAMSCTTGGAWTLVLYDVATSKRTDTTMAGSNPAFSPDSRRVVFGHGSDIAMFDVQTLELVRLTKNEWFERYPTFSPDGKRVYFESHHKDPNNARRVTSVIASVQVP